VVIMTAPSRVPVVPPVVLGVSRSRENVVPAVVRRLPVPAVTSGRTVSWIHDVVAVDDRGRVATRQLLRRVGCSPGTVVAIRERGGLLVVTADPAGTFAVTPQGYLRIPVAVQRRHGLGSGSRVLVVADPETSRLVVHPPASVDAMVAACHAAALADSAP
jgi:hypothetical protein